MGCLNATLKRVGGLSASLAEVCTVALEPAKGRLLLRVAGSLLVRAGGQFVTVQSTGIVKNG